MGICFAKKASKESAEEGNNRKSGFALSKSKRKKSDVNLSNLKIDYIKQGVGEITTNYRIDNNVIGSGCYGEVRRALHLPTKELRAIKVINKEVCTEEELENILQEIDVLKEADHPGIVRIYEYFNTPKVLYICMELIVGIELFDQIIELERFTEAKAADVISQLLEAVSFLHSMKIVHRDLKPENIMMEGNTLKLIDFGTSRKQSGKMTEVTGTSYYIAPEVLENNYDEKCDIWSCGVILYIMLSGEPPFNGEDDEDILENVKIGRYNFDNKIWKKISAEAKDLVQEMLTFVPKHRPSAKLSHTHKWIVENTPKIEYQFKKEHFENIKNFEFKNKLQESLYMFIVNNLVTKVERQEFATAFRLLDTNHDGTLRHKEIYVGFKKVGIDITHEEVDDILQKIDTNGDNVIGFTEFVSAALDKKQLLTEERVRLCFSIIDEDGSGKITVNELKDIFYSNGNGEDEVWKSLLEQADENGDGELEFEEFDKILKELIK